MSLYLLASPIATIIYPPLLLNSIGVVLAASATFIISFWLGSLVWAYQDIRTRTNSSAIHVIAMLPVLAFPVGGALIYLALRPVETLENIARHQMETEILLEGLGLMIICEHCFTQLEAHFLACPMCGQQVKRTCSECEQLIEMHWTFCSNCGSDLTEEKSETLTTSIFDKKFAEIESVGSGEYFKVIEGSNAGKDPQGATITEVRKNFPKSGAVRGRQKKKLKRSQHTDNKILNAPVS